MLAALCLPAALCRQAVQASRSSRYVVACGAPAQAVAVSLSSPALNISLYQKQRVGVASGKPPMSMRCGCAKASAALAVHQRRTSIIRHLGCLCARQKWSGGATLVQTLAL